MSGLPLEIKIIIVVVAYVKLIKGMVFFLNYTTLASLLNYYVKDSYYIFTAIV